MAYRHRLADLTPRDMHRLHKVHRLLESLFNGLHACGKNVNPALLDVVNQADDEIEVLFRKAVVGLLNHGRRGDLPRVDFTDDFRQHFEQIVRAMQDAVGGAGQGSPGASAEAAGELPGDDQQGAPAPDESALR